MSTPPKPVNELPNIENDPMYKLQSLITDYIHISGDELFDLAAAINKLYISREAHQAELLKARINELDEHIGIYNRLFEPNGEFRSFGSLKPIDVANLYTRIGERIQELEAELRDKFKLGDE